MNFNSTLLIVSGLTFIIYGSLCIFHGHMIEEFKRYKLENYRILTGVLELLGGLGSLAGLYSDLIYFISTGGLFLLMLFGVVTRLRVRDPLLLILPAFFLMIINGFLFLQS